MLLLQARLDDSGKYLCWVNNTAGEETIQVSLTVTGLSFVLILSFLCGVNATQFCTQFDNAALFKMTLNPWNLMLFEIFSLRFCENL